MPHCGEAEWSVDSYLNPESVLLMDRWMWQNASVRESLTELQAAQGICEWVCIALEFCSGAYLHLVYITGTGTISLTSILP